MKIDVELLNLVFFIWMATVYLFVPKHGQLDDFLIALYWVLHITGDKTVRAQSRCFIVDKDK